MLAPQESRTEVNELEGVPTRLPALAPFPEPDLNR